ncbi:MAG: hypothetical protein U0269_13365 [Polyangiales bacterium]
MTDLSPETRSAIDAAREQQGPSDEARQRMRSKLAATMGVAFALPLGAGLARTALAKLAATSITTKLIVATVVVASSAIAVRQVQHRPSAPAPVATPLRTERAHRASAAPPSAPLSAVTITQDPVTTDDARATVVSDAAVPSAVERPRPRPSMVEREASLIARADRALRDGQPASALVLVDEHRAQFSRGQLSRERDALEVLALCAIGRPSRAQQAMIRIETHALSPSLQQRLASSCAASNSASPNP